jgi:hypothetical protein
VFIVSPREMMEMSKDALRNAMRVKNAPREDAAYRLL